MQQRIINDTKYTCRGRETRKKTDSRGHNAHDDRETPERGNDKVDSEVSKMEDILLLMK